MSYATAIKWWNKYGLFAIVFVTGAAVLIVEVTATRILSPYYGNTIYMVSSVISVILGALSLGYWQGGIIADKHPTEREFYKIIYRGGISLFVLFLIMIMFLPIGGYFFSFKSGPLVWSLLLFFAPSYLLGMLSPFAITLAHKENSSKGLGRTTGQMFFWSTTGSIAGSLSAGFILIPYFGVDSIVFGTTLMIVLLGGIGYIARGEKKHRNESIVFLLFLVATIVSAFAVAQHAAVPGRVFVHDGIYERLTIEDRPLAGKPARFFFQDRSTSGIMYLDDTALAVDYTKYYALYKLFTPQLSRALVIGGGAYSIPKALHADLPRAQIDVAEIEPSLEHVAQTYFALPSTTSITTHIADGRRLLHDTKEPYDMIFSDVYYSLYSIPAHFITKEFFTEAKKKLSPNGIFIANVLGSSAHTPESLLFSEIHTMHSVFPNMEVFAITSTTSQAAQNYILVGINGTTTFESLQEALPLEQKELFSGFSTHRISKDLDSFNAYTILTDNYAPVEHLVSIMVDHLNQEGQQSEDFSGTDALKRITDIVAFGARAPNTEGHKKLKNYILETLKKDGITTTTDTWNENGTPYTNIIARINPNAHDRVILGSHYDSIARAYRDKTNPSGIMPGANNGASGVALLLEAAPTIKTMYEEGTIGIDIVFFDGEEGAEALGAGSNSWLPIGSTHFSNDLATYYPSKQPAQVLIFDMVCDKDLSIAREQISTASAPQLVDRFFRIGKRIAPDAFNSRKKVTIADDHLPFAQKGIPSLLVIDYEYEPWYNTTNDTPDKCSAESLSTVGNTLLQYLK